MISNIRDLEPQKCTGCQLCVNVCPFSAISVTQDREGFIVPVIINDLCKECGKCAKLCPSINPISKNYPRDSVLCLSKDKIIKGSASGGFFVTIAKYVITRLNGVVFGVILDEDFICKHAKAKTLDELIPMQNSKYIQSDINTVYAQAKKYLLQNRYVLFSGTPCQIAALKSFLSKDYDNLLAVDVVCHGVPNQKFWKKHIEHLKEKGKLISYTFRNRDNKNTLDPTSRVSRRGTLEATVVASKGIDKKPAKKDCYYCPFVKNESFRESCYNCQYAQNERVSDITMGDCDSEKNYPDFYPYESKSIVLLNTEKSLKFWNSVHDQFEHTALDYKKEAAVNTPLSHPSPRAPRRSQIYKDLESLPWFLFYYKYTEHKTIRQYLRKLLSIIRH